MFIETVFSSFYNFLVIVKEQLNVYSKWFYECLRVLRRVFIDEKLFRNSEYGTIEILRNGNLKVVFVIGSLPWENGWQVAAKIDFSLRRLVRHLNTETQNR